MPTILNYSPGQTVSVIQQVFNSDGYRADGYNFSGSGPLGAPVISRIIYPNLSIAAGYPVAMRKLDTGFYIYTFTLPTGAAAVGTYVVDGYWYDPATFKLRQDYFQIVVSAQYGQYSIGTI